METNNETVEQLCDNIRTRITELWDQDLGSMENGEVDEFADRIEAAYKREIAEKDVEIDQLKVRNIETQNAVDGRDKEIARLRALVKVLADNLECCASLYDDLQMFEGQKELNALVAKAREVAK